MVIIYDKETRKFHLMFDGNSIAQADRAKTLSKFAFAEGAFLVRHQYDLKLDDD